jgi:hypothetical protein
LAEPENIKGLKGPNHRLRREVVRALVWSSAFRRLYSVRFRLRAVVQTLQRTAFDKRTPMRYYFVFDA